MTGPPGPGQPADAGFVRHARAGDAEAVARVQAACWRESYQRLLPETALAELNGDEVLGRWRERWLESITAPPTSRHRVLVALESAEVVGFASAGPAADEDRWPATDGQLYEFRIEPGHLGRGHGGRLLHAVADTLAGDGFRIAVTWVLGAEDRLRGFLEAAGWAADGARASVDPGAGAPVPALRLHTALGEN